MSDWLRRRLRWHRGIGTRRLGEGEGKTNREDEEWFHLLDRWTIPDGNLFVTIFLGVCVRRSKLGAEPVKRCAELLKTGFECIRIATDAEAKMLRHLEEVAWNHCRLELATQHFAEIIRVPAH